MYLLKYIKGKYTDNNNLYIGVQTIKGEPYAHLTMNLGVSLDYNEAFINPEVGFMISELEKDRFVIEKEFTKDVGLYKCVFSDKFLKMCKEN